MFVRVKKIGNYEYQYLVENGREGGRHVQRVVKSLGRRDEVEASGILDGLIASAAKHSRRTVVLSSFYHGELPVLTMIRHVDGAGLGQRQVELMHVAYLAVGDVDEARDAAAQIDQGRRLHGGLGRRCAHGNTDRHRPMVAGSSA
jgi:hypothetical protein